MKESRPEVGSSQKSRDGFVNTSEANETLFLSPPEMPGILPGIPIFVFWHFDSANWKQLF